MFYCLCSAAMENLMGNFQRVLPKNNIKFTKEGQLSINLEELFPKKGDTRCFQQLFFNKEKKHISH